jgi:hypothetical protein
MDHSQTQRMNLTRRRKDKKKTRRKKQKGSHIPIIVANFIIRLIDKCKLKHISLDPPRTRTKQNII